MEESVLIKNVNKVLKSAELVYSNDDYTSATILYFKVLFGALDIILLRSQGKTPKDHTERFRMLQESRPDLYEFIDKYFKVYRDTYSVEIDKGTCDKVRKNVKHIIEEQGIKF